MSITFYYLSVPFSWKVLALEHKRSRTIQEE
jgi:hypothetical protein